MALIQCRECGAWVSDLAQSCPSCGCPVFYSLTGQGAPPMTPSENITQQRSLNPTVPMECEPEAPVNPGSSSNKTLKIALIVVICLGVVGLLIGGFFIIRELTDSPAQQVYYPPNYNTPVGTQSDTDVTSSTETTALSFPLPEGTWTSNLMDSVTIESTDGQWIYRHQQYDYDRCVWVESDCTVRNVTEDTITCVYDDGTIDNMFYTLSEDGSLLILDGVWYTTPEENPGDVLKKYRDTGVPAVANIYFGMTREEVKTYAGSTFTRDAEGDSYFKLPQIFDGQNNGFMVCDFDEQDKLDGVRVFLYSDSLTEDQYNALQQRILNAYTERYGDGELKSYSAYNTYIRWETGDVSLRYSEDEELGIILGFDRTG